MAGEQPQHVDLSNRRISEVVINMWKEQCKKINRYIPDKPQSGPNVPYPQEFNHGSNISLLLTAASSFKRLTEGMKTWKEKADFEHTEYMEVIKRNHIPSPSPPPQTTSRMNHRLQMQE
jgi:hypothetical protein